MADRGLRACEARQASREAKVLRELPEIRGVLGRTEHPDVRLPLRRLRVP